MGFRRWAGSAIVGPPSVAVDMQQLAAYLAHRMPAARDLRVEDLRRIPGGASRETWSFDVVWVEDGVERRRGLILRRDPDAGLLETDRAREYDIYRALAGTAIPVPRALWLEVDPTWLGRPFFIMERIDGCFAAPQALMGRAFERLRPAIAARKIAILGEIHRLDWQARGLASLGPPESPADCAPRELAHWRRVVEDEAIEPQPVLTAALAWLAAHPPPPAQRIALVHGDFRTGNFLFDRHGAIRGILDWEMAHLGDPLEDLAWLCLRSWRYRRDEQVGGLLPRDEAYRLYAQASGVRVDEEAVRWWEILGNVKLAAIFLTGARSFVEGRTHAILMAIVGRMLPPLEAELLDLLGW
jgi:aminoglycoside phosphotransferase (APT) family kinase protein